MKRRAGAQRKDGQQVHLSERCKHLTQELMPMINRVYLSAEAEASEATDAVMAFIEQLPENEQMFCYGVISGYNEPVTMYAKMPRLDWLSDALVGKAE